MMFLMRRVSIALMVAFAAAGAWAGAGEKADLILLASQGMDALPSASSETFAAEIRAEAPRIVQALKGCGAKIE